MNYIAFSGGGESLASILGGKVSVGISSLSEFDAQAKAGKLRILAVSSAGAPAGRQGHPDAEGERRRRRDPELAHGRRRPGHHAPEQKATLSGIVEKMAKSKAWTDTLKAKGWADTYLAGPAFEAQLAKDITATQTILKDVGLSN